MLNSSSTTDNHKSEEHIVLENFKKEFCNDVHSLSEKNDWIAVIFVFSILVVGTVVAFCYVPESLRFENFTPADFNKITKLPSLQRSFEQLCLTITFSLAQIPLEYLDSANHKIKRNFKAILVCGASAFAFMAFFYAY
jgi:hypothetical protein